MEDRVVFVIGSPRSGSTLLARMISSHSLVYGRPEPHLLTPLAHLGYYAKVEKAPYDAVLAAEALREFVADLPGGEQDYIAACRAYTDTLYSRMLATRPGKQVLLDKTPAYALILDFIARIYPTTRYVTLTRHPLAVFSSYAESFFNGDYLAAHQYNPILERYVPAIAGFLRRGGPPIHHVIYEHLVRDPDAHLQAIFAFLGLPHEPDAVNYGKHAQVERGLGDPIGVARHSRPTTESIDKWALEIGRRPDRLKLCRDIVARLDPADLAQWGYPVETIWEPVEQAAASRRAPRPRKWTRYAMQRRLIVTLRRQVGRHPLARRMLQRARLALDVLLRE